MLLYDGSVGRRPDISDPLQEVLAEYLDIPGMKAAILVSDEGLAISSATTGEIDVSGVAALVIDMVATVQRFGLQVAAGFLDTMSIEFEELSVVLAPFTPDVMLALVATRGSLSGEPRTAFGRIQPL
jgi:predicted regulator of Ras-like GTPase activity (Roadblock/LC7/MglB family)